MKIRFESLAVQGVPFAGSKGTQNIIVRIVVSNAEMVTEPTLYPGTSVTFPDIYEFGIDDVAFVAEMLNLEIDVLNVDNRSREVLLGKTTGNLRHLIPHFDQATVIALPLVQSDGSMGGEIRLVATVTEMETALAELKAKYLEEEQLRVAYNDLVTATKSLEAEMEDNMVQAQAQVDKVTKKYNALVEKYNELQDKFVSITVEYERVQTEVITERTEKESIHRMMTESVRQLRELNEELTTRVSELTLENESLNQNYLKATEDGLDAKQELEELYQSKYDTELQLNDRISELTEELDRLRGSSVNANVVEEMNAKIQQLVIEVNRLRILSVNNSVRCTTQFINQTFIENIVNNVNVTNMYISNILQSGDIEVLRTEFINLLRKYDEARHGEARLLDRLYEVLHNLRVFARTRPPSEEERGDAAGLVIENSGELPELSVFDTKKEEWQSYLLDGHWAYDGSQLDVFQPLLPLVHVLVPNPVEMAKSPQLQALKRHSAALVLGGPATGKAFTAFGAAGDSLGLAFRVVQAVFTQLDFCQNELVKEKARRQNLSLTEDADGLAESLFEYTVTLSAVEVTGAAAFDLIKEKAVANVSAEFDADLAWTSLTGVHFSPIADVNAGLQLVQTVATRAQQRRATRAKTGSATSVLLEWQVSVKLHTEDPPIVSRFVLAILPVDAAAVERSRDDNAKALVKVLEAIGANKAQEEVDSALQTSFLTKTLRGVLHPTTKTALYFTFAPMGSQVETTLANAALASQLLRVRREQAHGGGGDGSAAAADPIAVRTVQRRAKLLATELKEERTKVVQIEAKLVETKRVAEEYIIQFNERNKAVTKHYEDEKRLNQQLQSDLNLTIRNLRKAVDELTEQRKINEKLAALCKLLEKERQSLSAAVSTAQATAAASS